MFDISVQGEREGHDSESPVRKKTKEKKRKKSRKESTEASCEPEIGSEKRKDGVKGSLQSTPRESGDPSADAVIHLQCMPEVAGLCETTPHFHPRHSSRPALHCEHCSTWLHCGQCTDSGAEDLPGRTGGWVWFIESYIYTAGSLFCSLDC